MFTKIKNQTIHFFKRLTDVRFLGQMIFVFVLLLVSWSTTKAIQTNYELQKQVAQKQKQTELQKLRNENLKINNQYLQTDEYLELTARKQLGLAAPGEKLVIIPEETARKYTTESSFKTQAEIERQEEENKPFYQKNLESWGRFFLRR